MKRVRLHRGLRHYWGIRVRGQHTKTTGRHRAFAAMEASKGKKWHWHQELVCLLFSILQVLHAFRSVCVLL